MCRAYELSEADTDHTEATQRAQRKMGGKHCVFSVPLGTLCSSGDY